MSAPDAIFPDELVAEAVANALKDARLPKPKSKGKNNSSKCHNAFYYFVLTKEAELAEDWHFGRMEDLVAHFGPAWRSASAVEKEFFKEVARKEKERLRVGLPLAARPKRTSPAPVEVAVSSAAATVDEGNAVVAPEPVKPQKRTRQWVPQEGRFDDEPLPKPEVSKPVANSSATSNTEADEELELPRPPRPVRRASLSSVSSGERKPLRRPGSSKTKDSSVSPGPVDGVEALPVSEDATTQTDDCDVSTSASATNAVQAKDRDDEGDDVDRAIAAVLAKEGKAVHTTVHKEASALVTTATKTEEASKTETAHTGKKELSEEELKIRKERLDKVRALIAELKLSYMAKRA